MPGMGDDQGDNFTFNGRELGPVEVTLDLRFQLL
jgi:hypothetical protein